MTQEKLKMGVLKLRKNMGHFNMNSQDQNPTGELQFTAFD